MNTMIKKSRLALAIGLAGAVGLGAGSAMAADFQASVEVQNTVEVVNDGDLSFGIISIPKSAGADGDEAGEVAAMLLTPEGDTTTGSSDDTQVSIVSLGGAVPALASVGTGTDFTVEFAEMSYIDGLDDEGDLPDAFNVEGGEVTDDQITSGYQLSIGDPDAPSFYLVNMTVGEVDGGEVDAADDAHDPDAGEWRISPSFDSDEVGFAIGGTIVTDPDIEADYDETTYEGEFEVTARF